MINEAANKVLTDSGEPINKDLLLTQVKVIEADLDLHSEFVNLHKKYITDKTYATDESNRLIVQLEKFKGLCGEFKKSLNDKSLLLALDSYIDTITTRNAYIDHYNALFHQFTELVGESSRIQHQAHTVGALVTTAQEPGLPLMAAYVSGLYERAKAEAVWNLYHACRAYEFWALASADFSGRVGRNPQGLDSIQLQAALYDIRNSLVRTLEARRNYTPRSPSLRMTQTLAASSS
jgi:hypothetical protein